MHILMQYGLFARHICCSFFVFVSHICFWVLAAFGICVLWYCKLFWMKLEKCFFLSISALKLKVAEMVPTFKEKKTAEMKWIEIFVFLYTFFIAMTNHKKIIIIILLFEIKCDKQ